MDVITLDAVTFSYGHQEALEAVSGAFAKGSLTAVAGPNGAGKSTLLKMMMGVVKPQKGRVLIDPSVRHKIAYLPQAATIAKDYPLNVWQAVSAGLWHETSSVKALGKKARARIAAALREVGLTGKENELVGNLSGGQFQRMLFARLMLQEPEVVLLDEPFAAIDAETIARLIQILLRWHERGRTIICVLHDLLLIRKYFPESFVLAGRCMGRGHTHQMFEQKLLSFDLDMAELVAPKDASPQVQAHHAHDASCPCGKDHTS